MIRAALILVVALALSACSVFQIGERYDKSIDDDLNTFQTETVSFITSMRINAGLSAGAYTSDTAKAFYPKATARLANMMLRASLLSSRQCPISRTAPLPPIVSDAEAAAIIGAPITEDEVGGNCVVVMLDAVQAAFVRVEARHKSQGQIGETAAKLGTTAINNSVLIALGGIRSKDY